MLSLLGRRVVLGKIQPCVTIATATAANYTSRAHPKPIPAYEIEHAMDLVLEGVKQRLVKRQEKWDRNKPERVKRGIEDDGPYRNQNETIELALNLNLDPRKPGQALRGSLALPHGSGKPVKCVVFTSSEEVAKKALEEGAVHAGGEELVDRIKNGTVPLDFDRSLATQDVQSIISPLARTLGPRGLMPNAKVGTLLPTPEELLETLRQEQAGQQIQYRTEKAGIIHVRVGKGSFEKDALLENVRAVVEEIFDVKPESFGKGKKGKGSTKNAKYLLRAHLSSTQGKGVRVDLRTIDPTSNYFMSALPQA